MKFLPWLPGAAKPNEKRGNPLDNPSNSLSLTGGWEWLFSGGHETDAGELINDQTALKISTVYACVRVLSESVASLPIRLLRVTPQGRVQELEDPLFHLLGVAPNPEMTSFIYFETVAVHLSLTGTNENGTLLRTLNDIEVLEISVCSSPAYPQTAVSVRARNPFDQCPLHLTGLLLRPESRCRH